MGVESVLAEVTYNKAERLKFIEAVLQFYSLEQEDFEGHHFCKLIVKSISRNKYRS